MDGSDGGEVSGPGQEVNGGGSNGRRGIVDTATETVQGQSLRSRSRAGVALIPLKLLNLKTVKGYPKNLEYRPFSY